MKTLWELRNLSLSSQRTYSQKIKFLAKKIRNLDDTVATEQFILSLDAASKYKQTLLLAYLHYCKANAIVWETPKIKVKSAPICVPTEERIDKIISAGLQKWITVYSISKHGLRPDEVSKITLRDLDLERGLLTVRTSKLGEERIIKLKEYAVFNLQSFMHRMCITKIDVPIFPNPNAMHNMWDICRRRAFLNFRDTELLKIRLYDLRHWFATCEYLKTRDIFHVKYLLGHRDIKSTLIYMHIAQGLKNVSEDYTCRVARSVEEALKLIEAGFEYVTDFGDAKLFRIRK